MSLSPIGSVGSAPSAPEVKPPAAAPAVAATQPSLAALKPDTVTISSTAQSAETDGDHDGH
jgi:hypothetical protein